MSCTTSFSSFLTTPDDCFTVSASTAASVSSYESDVRRRQWAESCHENRDSAIYDQGIDLDAAAREESVGVSIQLRNFAHDTWQAPTPRAHAIKQVNTLLNVLFSFLFFLRLLWNYLHWNSWCWMIFLGEFLTGLRRTGAEDGLSTYARNTGRSVRDFKSVSLSDGSQATGFSFIASSSRTHRSWTATGVSLDPPMVVWASLTVWTRQCRSGNLWMFQHAWSCGNYLSSGPEHEIKYDDVRLEYGNYHHLGNSFCFQMGELMMESDAFESLVSRLNADVLLDTKLMEAMKLYVLSAALSLELADNLGDALPLFALALFSRPDSKNVKSLALNYLNPIGDSTTLERVNCSLHKSILYIEIIRKEFRSLFCSI